MSPLRQRILEDLRLRGLAPVVFPICWYQKRRLSWGP